MRRSLSAALVSTALVAAVPVQAAVTLVSPAPLNSRTELATNAFDDFDSASRSNLPYVSERNSSTGSDGSSSFASVTLDVTRTPSIRSNAVGNSSNALNGVIGANSVGYMAYEFVVRGPAATVDVRFDAEGSIRTTGDMSGLYIIRAGIFAIVQGPDPRGGFLQVNNTLDLQFDSGLTLVINEIGNVRWSGGFSNGFTGIFVESGTYRLVTNSIYSVQLRASAQGASAGNNFDQPGGDFSVSAFIDPVFSIAAGTPDAHLYSFEFSPGVGNGPVSGVPEPSTWAMMLVGFAGLGIAARRRREAKLVG